MTEFPAPMLALFPSEKATRRRLSMLDAYLRAERDAAEVQAAISAMPDGAELLQKADRIIAGFSDD